MKSGHPGPVWYSQMNPGRKSSATGVYVTTPVVVLMITVPCRGEVVIFRDVYYNGVINVKSLANTGISTGVFSFVVDASLTATGASLTGVTCYGNRTRQGNCSSCIFNCIGECICPVKIFVRSVGKCTVAGCTTTEPCEGPATTVPSRHPAHCHYPCRLITQKLLRVYPQVWWQDQAVAMGASLTGLTVIVTTATLEIAPPASLIL